MKKRLLEDSFSEADKYLHISAILKSPSKKKYNFDHQSSKSRKTFLWHVPFIIFIILARAKDRYDRTHTKWIIPRMFTQEGGGQGFGYTYIHFLSPLINNSLHIIFHDWWQPLPLFWKKTYLCLFFKRVSDHNNDPQKKIIACVSVLTEGKVSPYFAL